MTMRIWLIKYGFGRNLRDKNEDTVFSRLCCWTHYKYALHIHIIFKTSLWMLKEKPFSTQ